MHLPFEGKNVLIYGDFSEPQLQFQKPEVSKSGVWNLAAIAMRTEIFESKSALGDRTRAVSDIDLETEAKQNSTN